MAHFAKIYRVLLVFFVALSGAGCGEESPPPADPEADRCERVARRLTRDIGPITILESHAWALEDLRSVRVRFAYPETADGPSFGNIMCTFPFPVDVRGDKNRQPLAQSVYFQARYLSENELLLLNMSLRGIKP